MQSFFDLHWKKEKKKKEIELRYCIHMYIVSADPIFKKQKDPMLKIHFCNSMDLFIHPSYIFDFLTI